MRPVLCVGGRPDMQALQTCLTHAPLAVNKMTRAQKVAAFSKTARTLLVTA